MDDSKEFQLMLNKAIESKPLAFEGFDRTKNVQDQLQEMVIGRVFGGALALIDWAFSWRETIWNDYPFETIEQFWLAFVMKEKYGKTWDGEEWVTE